MSRYYKAILAALVPVLYAAVEAARIALGDGRWDSGDTRAVAFGAVGAVLVYAKANTPPAGQAADPTMSETDPATAKPRRIRKPRREPVNPPRGAR